MNNIVIRDVSITPNPVQTLKEYKISVSVEQLSSMAFVGSYVGSFVNTMNSENSGKLPLDYVGGYTKQ